MPCTHRHHHLGRALLRGVPLAWSDACANGGRGMVARGKFDDFVVCFVFLLSAVTIVGLVLQHAVVAVVVVVLVAV